MKKIISLVLVVGMLVLAGLIFIPRLAHNCDECGEFFIGTGYEPNVLTELIVDDDAIICKECAEKHHAVEISLGKNIDEFKRGLFD